MYTFVSAMDTRTLILNKNYEAMCKHGFQGLRTDKVIAELNITKGAFYHYFPSKDSVGYAVVDEIIYPFYTGCWSNLIKKDQHVIDSFIETLTEIKSFSTAETIHLGCPLNNLIQEMAPLDDGFRKRLVKVTAKIKQYMSEALTYGIQNNQVKPDIKVEETAIFILAAFEGSYSMGKIFQDYNAFSNCFEQLFDFLNNLKT